MRDAPQLGADELHLVHSLQTRVRFAMSTSGEASHPPLPSKPPLKWLEREDKKESPVDFIKRVYAAWIGRGLTRASLRMDPPLYSALGVWIHHNGSLPADLDLPTRKELNDRQLRVLKTAVGGGSLRKELRRLQSAAARRTY
jgi:hypothetical protein